MERATLGTAAMASRSRSTTSMVTDSEDCATENDKVSGIMSERTRADGKVRLRENE